MPGESIRITRKVKIDGRWIFAVVPMNKTGKPESGHVLVKGQRVAVSGGTYYLDHGHGKNRKAVACGTDPEGVRRAIATQVHVLELRRRGMDVGDAPEITEGKRKGEATIRDMRADFELHPPASFTVKTKKKYLNALKCFETWSAARGLKYARDVDAKTVARWISHMQQVELLDASTIVPKARIVMSELKHQGVTIKIADRDMPSIIEREREIYTLDELEALFDVCSLEEYELFQTFLLTGMRRMEVAFLSWADIEPTTRMAKVSAKPELGFIPKAYHERTVPIPSTLVELLRDRAMRLGSDGVGLIFGTSTKRKRQGHLGGKHDGKHLEKLKQVARREGLNCGRCVGVLKGEPVTCATHAICGKWGLHKFRHTYATTMLRDRNDIVTVGKWLGHKDVATTRIYLRALEAEAGQLQVEQSTLATRFGRRKPPAAGETKPIASRWHGR